MIFYPRYPAHYVAKTLHLTMEQDGAYCRLLDWMYANNTSTIPNDRVFAIVRAQKLSEKRAVTAVLNEFFLHTAAGWENVRVSAELAKAEKKSETSRINGMRSKGRPKKKPDGFPAGNPDGNPRPNPEGNPRHNPEETHYQIPDTNSTRNNTASAEYPASPDAAADARAPATTAAALLRGLGMTDVTPSRPELLALLAAGATNAQLVDTAQELTARRGGRPPKLGYLAATLQGRAADAMAGLNPPAGGTVTPFPAALGAQTRESTSDRVERLNRALDEAEAAAATPPPPEARDA